LVSGGHFQTKRDWESGKDRSETASKNLRERKWHLGFEGIEALMRQLVQRLLQHFNVCEQL